MNEPLSPVAQAVKDAVLATYSPDLPPNSIWALEQRGVAAALVAAADQVVPPDPCGDDCCIDLAVGIRADLLAIAAELKGAN